MAEQPRYAMLIEWSDQDRAYVVTVPDLPGCRTHGYSYEQAARQGQDAIESWLGAQADDGLPPPEPATRLGQNFNPLERLPIDREERNSLKDDLHALGIGTEKPRSRQTA